MLTSLAFIATLFVFAYAAPTTMKRVDGPGSPYQCTSSYGASNIKTTLQSMGADSRDLAIAILETGCDMDGTHYPMGDGKTRDSTNWGLFKNNWGSIRRYCSQFKGLGPSQYMKGQVLNNDPASAIKCQHEQIARLGIAGFYQIQRGIPGQGPTYGNAVEFINTYLKQGHLSDSWVTYYNLHAV